MKNLKKILVVLCIVAALSVGAAFAALAADDKTYTGTMEKLTPLVDDVAVQSANGTDKTYNALVKVINYLTKTPVDPESEGYAEKMASLDPYIADTITAYSDAVLSASDAAAKKTPFNKIVKLVEGFKVEDEALIAAYHGAAVSIAGAYLDLGLAPETTDFSAVKTAYDTAVDIIASTPLDDAALNAKVDSLALKMLDTYLSAIDTSVGISAKDKAIDDAILFLTDAGIDTEANIALVTAKIPGALSAACDAIASLATTDEKTKELAAIQDFIAKRELTDPASVAAFETAAFAVAEGLLGEVEDTEVESTAKNAIKINALQSFVDKEYIDPAANADYAALLEDFEERKALQAAAKDANRQAMLSKATITQYGYATVLDTAFEGSEHPFTDSVGLVGNKGTNFVGIDDNHFTITYGGTDTNGNTYAQASLSNHVSLKGVVVDFDFCTFSALPASGFSIEGGGTTPVGELPEGYNVTSAGKTVVYPMYFKVMPNGNICANDSKTVLLENSVVPGQWLHLTCIFNNDDFTFSLYCEYEHLGTYPANYFWNDGYTTMTYELVCARFNGSTTNTGEFSIDNLQIYQGTALRELGMLNALQGDEKFIYYANYYLDSTKDDVAGRKIAYGEASKLVSNYWQWVDKDAGVGEYLTDNAEIRAIVDRFNASDYDSFVKALNEYNRDEFIKRVEELNKLERTLVLANINDRIVKINAVDEFLTSIGQDIDRNEDFENANKLFAKLSATAQADKNALDFIRWMNRFVSMTTITSKEKYYNRATECLYMEGCPIDVSPEALENPVLADLKAAYEIYETAHLDIEKTRKNDNSKKIVACVEIITRYDRDTWDENFDDINVYVTMIRSTLKDKDSYNPDYKGLDDAIEVYNEYNAYFYGILQQRHIEELTARLNYIAESDAYIEKKGTLAYITRYLENNEGDIDKSNSEILYLIEQYETAMDEIDLIEVDYYKVLEQNAYYFISLVEKMTITQGYNEKKALYDAATPLYFALDGSVEGAMEAVDIYDQHTVMLENIEQSSAGFINAVLLLTAAETKDEIFACLVDCYAYSLVAESTFDGVTEAMAIFTEKYDAYCGEITVANEIITQTVVTTASVRANCGVESIVAVIIKKIFE